MPTDNKSDELFRFTAKEIHKIDANLLGVNAEREIAVTEKYTDIYLTVNEENENAIKVYEKFGFKVKSIAYSMQI